MNRSSPPISDVTISPQATAGLATVGGSETVPLGNFPADIVVQIARFLQPACTVSLSLTCKQIYCLLDGPFRTRLMRDDHCAVEHYKFLVALSRDFPDHVACNSCKALHSISAAETRRNPKLYFAIHCRYRANRTGFDRQYDDALRTNSYWIHHDFHFITFQMLMKRHRQGGPTLKFLESLDSWERFSAELRSVVRVSASTRIVDGCLLARSQVLIMLDESGGAFWRSKIYICSHYGNHAVLWKQGLCYRWPRRWRYLYDERPEEITCWGQIMRCTFCMTEFRFDCKPCGTHKFVVAFTRWNNLGEGRSFLDEDWQRHVMEENAILTTVDFEEGSICDAFEKRDVGFESWMSDGSIERLLGFGTRNCVWVV